MVDVATAGYVQIHISSVSGVEGDPGSSLTWNSITPHDTGYAVTDGNDNNLMDVGTDGWFSNSAPYSGYTITGTDGNTYAVFYFAGVGYFVPLPVIGSGQTIIPTSGTTNIYADGVAAYPLCFAENTLISTPNGERAIEDLQIGDLVQTASGATAHIKWVGRQTLMPVFGMADRNKIVEIKAGALGADRPHSDLRVTADHGMILDGLVINAGALVNHSSIRLVPTGELQDKFTVYHIETENHDVVLANGAASETFIDYAGRQAFDNYQEYLDLYGTETTIEELALPRISTARLLPQGVRQKLGMAEDSLAG